MIHRTWRPEAFWAQSAHLWLQGSGDIIETVDDPLPPERVSRGHKPYDWQRRKDGVMRRFKRVKQWVLPLGFAEAWFFEPIDPIIIIQRDPYTAGSLGLWWALLRFYAREIELGWLMQTQEQEIAPESAILAANGVEATTLDYEMGTEIEDNIISTAISDVYGGGRAEQWAKERDYQTWHTTPCRRARVKLLPDGRRSIEPNYGSEWSKEELLAILRRPPAQPDNTHWEESREEFEVEDQEARYQDERGLDYAASDPCPWSTVEYDGTVLCDKGRAPIYGNVKDKRTGTITIEVVDTGECQLCHGSGQVPATLGLALPAIWDEDFPL